MDTATAVAKVNSISTKLDAAVATLGKVKIESGASLATIVTLKQAFADAQANGGVLTPDLESAINAASEKADAVDAAANAVDELVPDAPVDTPPVDTAPVETAPVDTPADPVVDTPVVAVDQLDPTLP